MRILIFGAGVIGSLYGARLAEAGYDVSIYARGRRLESLPPTAHAARGMDTRLGVSKLLRGSVHVPAFDEGAG